MLEMPGLKQSGMDFEEMKRWYDGNEKSKRCQEKCGFVYHHTEENKPCVLMGIIELSILQSLQKMLGSEPSIKTIVKNGGKYERSFEFEGEEADIYTIDL